MVFAGLSLEMFSLTFTARGSIVLFHNLGVIEALVWESFFKEFGMRNGNGSKTDTFVSQFEFQCRRSALADFLSDYVGCEEDILPSSSQMKDLVAALEKSAQFGCWPFGILTSKYSGRIPTSLLLFACSLFPSRTETPTGIVKGKEWEYLIWFLAADFDESVKCSRLSSIFKHLRGDARKEITSASKMDIWELARDILTDNTRSRLSKEVIVLCCQWVHEVQGLKVLLDLGSTDGRAANMRHIAHLYLETLCREESGLRRFNEFFLEVSKQGRRSLALALTDTLSDSLLELRCRERIAEFMLDHLLGITDEKELVWFWRQYSEALIAFYDNNVAASHLKKVREVCERTSDLPDRQELGMSPLHKGWELLACFAGDAEIFNSLWLLINSANIDMQRLISERAELVNQCQREARRCLVSNWMQIVRRFVRACYREDKSLRRLLDSLRASSLGPVALVIGEIGEIPISSLNPRGEDAILSPDYIVLKSDDPLAVSLLIRQFIGRGTQKDSSVQTLERRHRDPEYQDKVLVTNLTAGDEGKAAAQRLLKDFSNLSSDLKVNTLLLVLRWASAEEAHLCIEACGGGQKCFNLISEAEPNFSERGQELAGIVADWYGHLLTPL